MVTRPEVLAIIPARGASKSIPRKNIRSFAGHPLIAYSVAAGLKAESITRLIASTDDQEIADIAERCGAEVPFLRPAELSRDDSADLPLFQHALTWLEKKEDYRPDIVVQLRPTSPVRPPNCVDLAIRLLLAHPDADSVRGVVPTGQNPYKMWQISPNDRLVPLLTIDGIPEPYNMPRQSLPLTYWQTGHVDVIRAATILEKESMNGDAILPLVMDARYNVDIDTLSDWQRAEWIVLQGELDIVSPDSSTHILPDQVSLVVFDFDGVLTDNRVWVDESGHEQICADRGDGMGLNLLCRAGIEALVLSTEANPVVTARCNKLGLQVRQGIADKGEVLRSVLDERKIDPAHVIYVGNDINDIPCFQMVGCAVAVADAHPNARRHADLILSNPGGHGAVRELCDLLLERLAERSVR